MEDMEEDNKSLLEYANKSTTKNSLIEIVSATFLGPVKNLIGNITIWHPEGVDLDMCEEVSNGVNEMIDADDPFDFPYTLEISSLSLTRKLKLEDDFRRAIGETITIKYNDKGKKEVVGRLVKNNENEFTIENVGKESHFKYTDIKHASINFK